MLSRQLDDEARIHFSRAHKVATDTLHASLRHVCGPYATLRVSAIVGCIGDWLCWNLFVDEASVVSLYESEPDERCRRDAP